MSINTLKKKIRHLEKQLRIAIKRDDDSDILFYNEELAIAKLYFADAVLETLNKKNWLNHLFTIL